MFGYHWLDRNHWRCTAGRERHGVGSSLLRVGGQRVSAKSLPDTGLQDPGQGLKGLNDVFQMEKQNGKYFTIWYGVFHKKNRTLAYGKRRPSPRAALPSQNDRHRAMEQFFLLALDPMIGMLPGRSSFREPHCHPRQESGDPL